jgi:signal transduction histidine kinase/ActR/RegA family two-component response regulator/PAS domain-containing protein
LLLLLALIIVLLGCWLLYRLEAGRIADQQRQRETARVAMLTDLLRSELRPGINDVRLLGDGDGLRDYLETGRDSSLQAAIRRARFVSLSHPEYDQIRFIDQEGNEILRVNQGGRVVPSAELQNKERSPYFRQASTLAPGSVYISDFDLTIENGELVTPLKPVLRFAVPVFDAAGQRRGIYVISRLGTILMSELEQMAGTYRYRLRVLDDKGNWLKAADSSQEWGAALPEREQFSLPQTNPELWARMQTDDTGQSSSGDGLFTWEWLLPDSIAPSTRGRLHTATAHLIVASEVSPQEWAELFAGLRHILDVAAPGLMLLTLLSAWLIRARGSVMLKLRSMNQILEQRVRERTQALARSNDELQYREALLQETGHLAKVGGWELDPETGEGSWTAEVAQIHDLPPTLRPSKDLGLQFYPGESRTRIEAALRKTMQDGSPYDLELEFVSAKGVHKWIRTIGGAVLKDGRVVRMRGAFQDITDRKLTELRLHSQLQRMNLLERTTRAIGEREDLASILQVVADTLVSQLPLDFCCVCMHDAADRDLTVAAIGKGCEPLAAQLAMHTHARIPGDDNAMSRCMSGSLVYEEDISRIQHAFPQRLAAQGLRALVAAPLLVESQVFGVLFAARKNAQSFTSNDCEFLRQLSEHVALAAHQAQLNTALKAAYEDLRSTQQTVMQQERLRVLGQMASGIAHDINNAISPIMLYTDTLLEREPGLSERARDAVRTIQQAVSDVAETVARMREFYRPRETLGELQPVQLNALVLQLRDLTRARWETIPQQKGIVIDLQLDLRQDLPPALGISTEIREALINLVFNAVDAMPDGGRLIVRTLAGDTDRVCVEVEDSGTGMDLDTRRRCLEPFFSTKGEQGTGLGLALVYGVMQRHGGEIDIQSTPGTGTTVRLCFAVAHEQNPATAEPGIEVPSGLDILLVDDDPILLRTLSEVLEHDGHNIVATDSGQEGIDIFQASMQQGQAAISVVITDLGMPHVDGRAVAAAVKRTSPSTPVILLTGWGERLLAEGQAVAHVDRVLGKPPRLRDLRKALAELVVARAETT